VIKRLNKQLFPGLSILFFSIALFLGLLSSCTPEYGQEGWQTEAVSNNFFRFGISSAPVTLDPRFATDATSSRINRLIYQKLVEFDDNNLPKPGITQWQKLSNTHYRFMLLEKQRFHHGKWLTSDDIKATYDYILDKKNGSPHRDTLKHIRDIVLVDDHTVDFILERADPLFPAFLVVGILPADLIRSDHAFNTQPVGSGAFRFVKWPYDGQLILQRNKDQQYFEFLKVKDPTVRVLKLLRGEIDLIQNNLPPEHISYLRKQDSIESAMKKGENYSYLGFNLVDEQTRQPDLRRAIAYALNREQIIHFALGEAASPANSFFPPEHWAGAELVSYDFDLPKARKLMRKLGFSETKHLQLTYKTSSDPFRIRIATIIQSQLRNIFIDVDIRSYDWGTFYGDIKKGKFQLYSLTWVGIKTPDIFRYVFHSQSLPPSGANRGRLNDSVVDEMIEQAEKEPELKEQAKLYQQLQQKLHELLPYVSLWYEENIAFFRQETTGYRVSADGNYDGLNYVSKKQSVD
jgi:peptide/nickel transport system substrate-binding protein